MGLRNIYNSIGKKTGKIGESISSLFDNSVSYQREKTPEPVIPKGTVNPNKIATAIRQLESSGGIDPNTPMGQTRSYTTVPANQNEQARTIEYDVGLGGEYGITPVALAELAGSKIDNEADPSTYTQYGKPLIPGMKPEEIQRELMSSGGAGRLAVKFFMMKRNNKEDYTPQSLANDYIDFYVGKGGESDTPQNRKRALDYFTSLMEQ